MLFKINLFSKDFVYTLHCGAQQQLKSKALDLDALPSIALLKSKFFTLYRSDRIDVLNKNDILLIEEHFKCLLRKSTYSSFEVPLLVANNLDFFAIIENYELDKTVINLLEKLNKQKCLMVGYFHGDLWHPNILKNDSKYYLIDYDRCRRFFLPQLDIVHFLLFNNFFSVPNPSWNDILSHARSDVFLDKLVQFFELDLSMVNDLVTIYLITTFAQNEVKFKKSIKYLRWVRSRCLFMQAIHG